MCVARAELRAAAMGETLILACDLVSV